MPTLPWTTQVSTSLPCEDSAQPLARRVRESLLTSILHGEFAPGDRITEPELAERLQVSRVPVREALRELESLGLLESRKHTGVFVRRLGKKETTDLYGLRSLLEAHASGLAAKTAGPALLSTLKALVKQMDHAAANGEIATYYSANLSFHWEIVSQCGNDEIVASYRGLVQKLHVARMRNLSSIPAMQTSQQQHQAILNAIAQGDSEQAYQLAYAHVTAASQRFLGVLP
jgi:DNA-binding GntR family transcriptional regulator